MAQESTFQGILKADHWQDIAANTAIPTYVETTGGKIKYIVGIAIETTGTCIALDVDDNEKDMSNYPAGDYGTIPNKLKTGLAASVVALYK